MNARAQRDVGAIIGQVLALAVIGTLLGIAGAWLALQVIRLLH